MEQFGLVKLPDTVNWDLANKYQSFPLYVFVPRRIVSGEKHKKSAREPAYRVIPCPKKDVADKERWRMVGMST